MLDPKHVLIRQILDAGYRIAYHEHLRGARVVSSYEAWKTDPREKHSGRCALGNPEKALEHLASRMGIDDVVEQDSDAESPLPTP